MFGRCEICGKDGTSLHSLYDFYVCGKCEDEYKKRTEKNKRPECLYVVNGKCYGKKVRNFECDDAEVCEFYKDGEQE